MSTQDQIEIINLSSVVLTACGAEVNKDNIIKVADAAGVSLSKSLVSIFLTFNIDVGAEINKATSANIAAPAAAAPAAGQVSADAGKAEKKVEPEEEEASEDVSEMDMDF
ncbi:MAG: hypothetical protein MHPSP_000219 [Paramarteilia canceri]